MTEKQLQTLDEVNAMIDVLTEDDVDVEQEQADGRIASLLLMFDHYLDDRTSSLIAHGVDATVAFSQATEEVADLKVILVAGSDLLSGIMPEPDALALRAAKLDIAVAFSAKEKKLQYKDLFDKLARRLAVVVMMERAHDRALEGDQDQ